MLLLAALIGGAIGAALTVRLLDVRALRPPADTPAADTPALALARALPAIVTVLADLPPGADAQGQRVEPENIGSGIVVHEGGLIITNYHVVAGATRLTVVLGNGERRPAEVLADDSPFHDLALLRVPPGGLNAAVLGDSDALRRGDRLVVVSSGLVTEQNQVKAGVVSALHLDFLRPGLVMQDMVQTDAPVNHGDSGGALLNEAGEVVGLVTTAVRQNQSGDTLEGVGLAHSINSLRPVIDAVVATGVNPRLRLGIERLGTEHTPIDREQLPPNSPYTDGVAIVAVEQPSPAAAAGIRVGDVVTAVNGQPIEPLAPFVNLLGASPAGRDVQLAVFRDGRLRTVTVSPQPIGPAR